MNFIQHHTTPESRDIASAKRSGQSSPSRRGKDNISMKKQAAAPRLQNNTKGQQHLTTSLGPSQTTINQKGYNSGVNTENNKNSNSVGVTISTLSNANGMGKQSIKLQKPQLQQAPHTIKMSQVKVSGKFAEITNEEKELLILKMQAANQNK